MENKHGLPIKQGAVLSSLNLKPGETHEDLSLMYLHWCDINGTRWWCWWLDAWWWHGVDLEHKRQAYARQRYPPISSAPNVSKDELKILEDELRPWRIRPLDQLVDGIDDRGHMLGMYAPTRFLVEQMATRDLKGACEFIELKSK